MIIKLMDNFEMLLVWGEVVVFGLLLLGLSGCGADVRPSSSLSENRSSFEAREVRSVLGRAFNYELRRRGPIREQGANWRLCALYVGAMEASMGTGDESYRELARRWSQSHNWEIRDDQVRNADYQCIGQVYLGFYLLEQEPYMIRDTRRVFDRVLNASRLGDEMWSWADALFMAPPVLSRLGAATGNSEYFRFMSQKFWEASSSLFDAKHGLYYRDERFVDQQTESGEGVFWSRGNGWVLAGIARVLQHLPEDHDSHDKFVERFRTMAAAVAPLQHDDGRWRTSLLDSGEYPAPETSGTAFFTYALAWGINEGHLSSTKYRPVVEAGWEGLVEAVNDEGRLGWVQSVGAEPGPVQKSDTGAYAVGGFLMAGSEVLRMIEREKTSRN